jgi:hypothetical protein
VTLGKLTSWASFSICKMRIWVVTIPWCSCKDFMRWHLNNAEPQSRHKVLDKC